MADHEAEQREEQVTSSEPVGRVRLKPDRPADAGGTGAASRGGDIAERVIVGLGAVLLMVGALVVMLYGVFRLMPQ